MASASPPDTYREQARRARQAAAAAKDEAARKELLFIAQQYERLAEQAEKNRAG